MRKVHYLLVLMILLPICAATDHDCIDSRPNGYRISHEKKLPKEWLVIGDRAINDPKLHSELRTKYKTYYVTNENGSGFICLYVEGVYITISDTEFGPWFEFSSIQPKCWKCNPVKTDLKDLSPKSGLSIGQTKTEVSSLLGTPIPREDVVEIVFHEIEKGKKGNLWHDEKLTLEFKEDKLIRFSFYDYREGA